MWLRFALLLLVGAAFAEHYNAWKTGQEYLYLVRIRSLTSLDIKNQSQASGIIIKATLKVQVESPESLRATLITPYYSRVHRALPQSMESEISDRELDLVKLPITGKPFEIKIKHGVIRDLRTAKDIPNWELNFIKSVVSQLQFDVMGENARKDEFTQIPNDQQPFGMFRTVEDSVSGRCEVLYDMLPLSDFESERRPDMIPMPFLGKNIEIIKTRNSSDCEEKVGYHFGTMKAPLYVDDKFITRSTMTRAVISGQLGSFTIQSSVVKDKIFVKPTVNQQNGGIVFSKVNVTLANINTEWKPIRSPDNIVSVGNLLYIYDNPFVDYEDSKRSQNVNNKRYVSESSKEEQNPLSFNNRRNSEENDNPTRIDIKADQILDTPIMPHLTFHVESSKTSMDDIQNIVREIATDLEDSDNVLKHSALEKFTILVSAIRSLKSKDIDRLEKDLKLSIYDIKNGKGKNMNLWKVFRDAVTQAGTGPALITIGRWLSETRLVDLEAALTISKLSRVVRTLTPAYLKAFFEIVKDTDTSKQFFLRHVSVVVLGEMIRNSKHRHNYLTRYIKGIKVEEDPAISDTYIPYLKEELQKAVRAGISPRVMTYIRALGYTGDPTILSIFEPYLEGRWRISKTQRATIVASLNELIETSPSIVRSVLYKIYLNKLEAHEVRCLSVLLLMKTKPSLAMLQRMAEFTYYDTDKNVNSVVKSSIENAAAFSQDRDFAARARIVKKLLPSEDLSNQYSKNRVETIVASDHLIYRIVMDTVGSDDTDIPKGLYISTDSQTRGFRPPETQVGYLTSSVKQLTDLMKEKIYPEDRDEKRSKESIVDDIARTLRIQPQDPQQVEGNVYLNSMYGIHFYAFDNHTLERLVDDFKEHVLAIGKTQDINLNQINSYEVEVGFATESGLPFVFTMKEPTLVRVQGKKQFDTSSSGGSKIRKAKVAVSTILAKRVQGRIGFITHFEDQHYGSGVDVNAQLSASAEVEVETEVENEKCIVTVKHRPLTNKIKNRLLHYSATPYTWASSTDDHRPRRSSKGYYRIGTKKPHHASFKIGKISIEVETDSLDESKSLDWKDYSDALVNSMTGRDLRLNKFDLYLTVDQERNDWMIINIARDNVEVNSVSDYPSPSKTPVTIDTLLNSEQRMEQMIQEVSKDVSSGTAEVVDISIDISSKKKGVLTVAQVNDEAEKKSSIILYGNIQRVENKDVISEVCASVQSRSEATFSGLDVEETLRNPPKKKFKVGMVFGKCAEGKEIKIEGKEVQSDVTRNALLNSRLMRKCQEEIKQGNKGLEACQEVNSIAETPDQWDISMNIEPEYSDMIVDTIQSISSKRMTTLLASNPKDVGKDTVDMRLFARPDSRKGDISFSLPSANLSIPYRLSPRYFATLLGMPSNENHPDVSEKLHEYVSGKRDESSCTLDVNMASTFDDRVYPFKLGQCWHVMMITVPQENPDNPNEILPIPQEMKIAVLAREEEQKKEIKVIVGDKAIELKRSSSSRTEVLVNGQTVKLSKNKARKEKGENGPSVSIMELDDGSIKIEKDDKRFSLAYDGRRVRIKVSPEFRNVVGGLCGNYDSQTYNDLLTPEKCATTKPEEFVASFAMVQDNCRGEAITNKQKAEKSKCIQIVEQQSNVVSDTEAGRNAEEMRFWGYHMSKQEPLNKRCAGHYTKILEEDERICFSVKPVPLCETGCVQVEVKPKKYPFHCMPKTEATLQMKDRIEQGANPDMSRKSVHFSKVIEVPVSCTAA